MSISTEDIRSLIARSMRSRPDAVLVLHQLADRAHPAVAEVVDVVDLALPSRRSTSALMHGEDVFLAQRPLVSSRVEVEAHVHLHPADRRQVIALGSKNSEWNIACAASMVGGSPGRMTR